MKLQYLPIVSLFTISTVGCNIPENINVGVKGQLEQGGGSAGCQAQGPQGPGMPQQGGPQGGSGGQQGRGPQQGPGGGQGGQGGQGGPCMGGGGGQGGPGGGQRPPQNGGGQMYPPPPPPPPMYRPPTQQQPPQQQPRPENPDQVSFNGAPHDLVFFLGVNYVVVDRHGKKRTPGTDPFNDGDCLKEVDETPTTDEAIYAEVLKVMGPIRDVLMYLPESVSAAEWNAMTTALTDLKIKVKGKKSGPLEYWEYSTDEILAYSRASLGVRSVVPITRYLIEAELALKCHYFKELKDALGRDVCKEVQSMNPIS